MSDGNFRLYDFEACSFRGPLETRKQAEKRKSNQTKGKRDVLTNWYRTRVHPVAVEADGITVAAGYRATIDEWRNRLVEKLKRDPRKEPQAGDLIRMPGSSRIYQIAKVDGDVFFYGRSDRGKWIPMSYCTIANWPRLAAEAEVIKVSETANASHSKADSGATESNTKHGASTP